MEADPLSGGAATESVEYNSDGSLKKKSIHLLLIPASCDQWHLSQVKTETDTSVAVEQSKIKLPKNIINFSSILF